MSFETIILEKKSHIAILTLNRPAESNAVNQQMIDEFIMAIDDISIDDDIRALILNSNGEDFSIGKIPSAPTAKADKIYHSLRHNQESIQKLYSLEKPVIASLRGRAQAIGVSWALAADIRIGSENFRFRPFMMNLGSFPGGGTTYLLPWVVGWAKAAEILYTRDWVDANEAYRIGFLNKLLKNDELESATIKMAEKCAAGPPIATKLAKIQLMLFRNFNFKEAQEFMAAAEPICLKSEDYAEGIAAEKEGRPPLFHNK